MCLYMIFANMALLFLLCQSVLDVFIDGTFDMTPNPFYQVLIVMVYCQQTDLYVPVMYCLMTHKADELYNRVLAELLKCAQKVKLTLTKLDVRNYTSDFKAGLFNAYASTFSNATHIGFFYHLKQAIR